MAEFRLHAYWLSGTAYRTRIALNLKQLEYDVVPVDLPAGAQRSADFLALNAQGLVPVLEADGQALFQSMAILEWLEEAHPSPPLLPAAPFDRARVRAMANLIACDIHPLGNLRVLKYLKKTFSADPDGISHWVQRWIGDGFGALEPLVAQGAGTYAFGDSPTFVDCCLVPQVAAAERYGVGMDDFPAIRAVYDRALDNPAIAAAAPALQPDAPPGRPEAAQA